MTGRAWISAFPCLQVPAGQAGNDKIYPLTSTMNLDLKHLGNFLSLLFYCFGGKELQKIFRYPLPLSKPLELKTLICFSYPPSESLNSRFFAKGNSQIHPKTRKVISEIAAPTRKLMGL